MVGLEDPLDCPATLNDIPLQTPCQPQVVVSLHKNLEIEHIVDFAVKKTENALVHHKGTPLDMLALLSPFACDIVVLRNDHILALLQLEERLLQEWPVKHARVVKVDTADVGHLLWRTLFVEAV